MGKKKEKKGRNGQALTLPLSSSFQFEMRSVLSCATRGASILSRGTIIFSSSKTGGSGSSGGARRRRPRPPAIANAASSTSTSTPPPSSDGREHPPFPRVGVAAVLFRPRPTTPPGEGASEPSLLLIQRAKPPNQGLWSFPGGALELGEAVVSGAERELSEEVPGLEFERDASVAGGLAGGVAFAAANSIHYDSEEEEETEEEEGGGKGEGAAGSSSGGGGGNGSKGDKGRRGKRAKSKPPPRFHWAIVEVAAVAKSSSGSSPSLSLLSSSPPPETADDASASRWVGALSELRRLEEQGRVTPGCARVAAEAVKRFGKDLGYRAVSD